MFRRLRRLRELQQQSQQRRRRGLSPVSASIQHDIDEAADRRARLDDDRRREERRRRHQDQQEGQRRPQAGASIDPARALFEHSVRDWEQRQERRREMIYTEERTRPPDCDGSNHPILSTGIVVAVDGYSHDVHVRNDCDDGVAGDGTIGGETIPLSGDVCPICMSDYRRGDRVRYSGACCRHAYHAACIDRWLRLAPGEKKEECPCCRQKFGIDAAADAAAAAANESRRRQITELTFSYLERISLYGTINTDFASPVSSPSPPTPVTPPPPPPPPPWPGIVISPIED